MFLIYIFNYVYVSNVFYFRHNVCNKPTCMESTEFQATRDCMNLHIYFGCKNDGIWKKTFRAKSECLLLFSKEYLPLEIFNRKHNTTLIKYKTSERGHVCVGLCRRSSSKTLPCWVQERGKVHPQERYTSVQKVRTKYAYVRFLVGVVQFIWKTLPHTKISP